MGQIEKLSNKLSTKICNNLDKSESERQVLSYGFFIIIHTFLGVAITVVIGIIMGCILEISLITLITAILKRTSGGSHATSPRRCLIIGTISSIILTLATKFVIDLESRNIVVIIIIILITMVSYATFYKNCPVGSKNKPLKNRKRSQKMRKLSFRTLNLLLFINIVIYFLYTTTNNSIFLSIILSIVFGIGLQTLSLTKVGNKYVYLLDNLLINIKI